MVTCFDVCEILEMLSEASVKVFLDGGWGVDALIGRETRTHNDIDLFVEKKDYCITISVITGKGYREVIMDYTTDSSAFFGVRLRIWRFLCCPPALQMIDWP